MAASTEMKDEIDPAADALIDDFKVDEGTFDIELPNGKKVVVRKICSVEDMTAIQKKTMQLLRLKDPHPSWLPFLPISEQTASIMAEFDVLVQSPKFKDVQVLRLCKQAGPIAAFIHSEIIKSMAANVSRAEGVAIDEEKNGSQE